MKKVSVVIPAYNSSSFIIDTINSVLNQTYSNFEIVVVDDGSTNDIMLYLADFIATNKIVYIHQQNLGTGAARNAGIKYSNGQYIALLDHDDLWDNRKLESQVNYLNANLNVGLVYNDYFIMNTMTNETIPSHRESCSGNVYKKFLYRNYITTGSQVLFRRECLELVGLFDESLKIVDDYKFYINFSRYYEFGYINKCFTYWRVHESNTSGSLEKTYVQRFKMKQQLFRMKLSLYSKAIVLWGLMNDYSTLGYHYYNSRNKKASRHYFLLSIVRSPLISIKYIMLSFLSDNALNIIKNIVRR